MRPMTKTQCSKMITKLKKSDKKRSFLIFLSCLFHLNKQFKSDQEDYSDDDDVSWKIRRAAAKCLDAIINTRHELLNIFYSEVSPILISRFKGNLDCARFQRLNGSI